jgi:hypothetical protein
MASIGEVYFGLYGEDFEPNDISEYTGLTATGVRRRGELNPVVPIPKKSSWKFSTGKIEGDLIDVYEMSDDLVAQLAPYAEKILQATIKFNLTCKLQVVLWIDQDESKSTPAIGFERSVLDFLTAVGATIDIDTYRN